ncbi:PAS domain-containing protein [Corallococcus sp. CA053C]|uniref:PAS domain-containing protein n=1 Tax=Corallococcus sp. CA053C TaxID=2316732 RepID=UPI001315944E|nr:PAS domain-containing protein [Corallococcus sp. CA053C]
MSTSAPLPFASEALNPDGFLVLRPVGDVPELPEDFTCEYANPSAQALLGDSLVGEPFLASRPTWKGLRATWGATRVTGLRSEHLLRWDTGSGVHTLRVRAARARDGTLYVWLSDLSWEVRASVDAMPEQDLLVAALEHLPEAFVALDGQFQVRRVNRAAEQLLGRPREQLEGQLLWGLVEGEPDVPLRQPLLRALVTGQPTEFDTSPGTSQQTLHVTAVPTASGLLLYLKNTSRQHRGEEALRRASALFQAVMQGCPDALYTKNLEGRYTRINAAGAKLMGRQVEEVLGHTDEELWPDEARASMAHDREVLAFRRTLTYEEAQSGRVWLSTKGVLRDEQGQVFGLFGISRDISERKRMEEALRQNEVRLQQALAAASVTLFDLRMPEGLLRWERDAATLLGQEALAPEEPLAALLARVHPEDRLSVAERLHHWTRIPGEVTLDFRVLDTRGGIRRLTLWGRARTEDGRVQRIIGILVDMTRRSPESPAGMVAA